MERLVITNKKHLTSPSLSWGCFFKLGGWYSMKKIMVKDNHTLGTAKTFRSTEEAGTAVIVYSYER
jgi:hypothetical protein